MAYISKITTFDGTVYNLKDPNVPEWARNNSKPTYTANEVGAPTVEEMNATIRESTAIVYNESFYVKPTILSGDSYRLDINP